MSVHPHHSELSPPDLRWRHCASRELFRLAWPTTVGMLSYALMTLVDTLFVGRLGTGHLAGVGLAGTVFFTLVCFPSGLLRGAKTLIAQARGAGNTHDVGGFAMACVLWAVIGSAVAVFAGFFAHQWLPTWSATPSAAIEGQSYLGVRLLSIPVVLVFAALRETRFAMGDTRSPMVASVVGNLLNIGLDYAFIFEFNMGVAGAAWATLIAHVVELLMLSWVHHRTIGFGHRVSESNMRAVLRLGFPSGLQFLLEVGAFAVLAALLSRYSELAIGAHMIALQVIHFSFLPPLAVGEAASVMVGEAVGARRRDLVLPVSKRAVAWAMSYTLGCSVVLVLWGRQIAGAFTTDPALINETVKLLGVAAVFQVFDGAYIVARSVLRGVGDVKFPAAVGVVLSWVCTPPLTLALGYGLGWGAFGGWLGLCAEIILGGTVLWWRLKTLRWHRAADRLQAIKPEPEPETVAAAGHSLA